MRGWIFHRRGFRRAASILTLALAFASGCTWLPTRPQQVGRSLADHEYPAEAVGSPAFEEALDRYTGTVARPANAARLLQDGDQAYAVMHALIASAKERISMETYIVERDQTTDFFFDLLAEAAQRGVKVRFMADAAGYRRGLIADLAELGERGVEARVFNPLLLSWTVLRGNNRDHRKILVVDGRHAILGGLNLADEQLGDGVSGWRDTAIWVAGPAAADAERAFAETWEQAGRGYFGRDLPVIGINEAKRGFDEPFVRLRESGGGAPRFDPPAYPAADPEAGDGVDSPPPPPEPRQPPARRNPDVPGPASAASAFAAFAAAVKPGAPPPALLWPGAERFVYDSENALARVVCSKPDSWNAPTYDLMILALYGARERVDISMAYFVPPLALKRALLRAAGRGVRVRLLVPEETDVKYVRELGGRIYGELMDAGVEIYEWPYEILHSKSMVVDGAWTLAGSCNMDSRSFFMNYESIVAVTDAALAKRAHCDFEADLSRAARLTREAWEARGFRRRMIEVFMRPLAGQY